MNSIVFNLYFLLRVLALILSSIGFGYVFWKEDWVFTQIVIGSLVLIISIELIFYIRRTERDLNGFLDILNFEDYSRHIGSSKNPSKLIVKMEQIKEQHEQRSSTILLQNKLCNDILEEINIGVCVVNQGGKIELINSAFSRMLNISKVSSIKQLISQIPSIESCLNSDQRDIHFLLEPEDNDYQFQRSLNLNTLNRPTELNTKQVLILSENKKNQNSLDFDAWLNFGKVITHEINNGITPIRSLSESIINTANNIDSDFDKKRILKASKIIIEQCDSLMSFNSKYTQLVKIPPLKTEAIDLQKIIKGVFELYQNQLNGVDVRFNFLDRVALIQADKSQLEMVFINLIRNSISALNDVEVKSIKIDITERKDYYLVAFGDTGLGISDENKSSIFIPYFSTKENGSGIGLSLARQILWKHGARIHLKDNQENSGCTFVLVFPKKGMGRV